MTRVEFERLTSRTGYLYLGGTLLVAWAVLGYLFVTRPETRALALLLPLVTALLVWVAVRHRQWVEVGGDGPLLVQRRAFWTGRVPLRTAREVRLSGNGAGHVQLVAKDERTTVRAPVLALTPYVERSQPAPLLAALTEALEGVRAKGAAQAREDLLAQLDHVRAGGSPKTSPLVQAGR